MCKCRSEIRKELMQQDSSIKAVYFDLDNVTEWETDKEGKRKTNAEGKTGQRIEIYYDHTMKNGEVRRKKRKSFVGHTFCPFCGKKYKGLNS